MVYFEKVRDAENLSSQHCLFFPSSLQHPCEHLPKVEDGAGLLPPPLFLCCFGPAHCPFSCPLAPGSSSGAAGN